MSLDSNKLGFSTFKILIHINNTMDPEKFEKHLISIKNLKHISKMIGQWDYEIDVVHKDILKIQELIEDLKHKFPDFIKNIEIINFGRRMITGNNLFKI